MLAEGWTWLSAVPVALAALALLWLPGGLLALGLGAGRWSSLALAPVLSTSLVTGAGIVCGLLGVAWGLGPLLSVGIVLPLVVVGGRLVALRSGWWVPRLDPGGIPGSQMIVGGAVAAIVAVITILHGVSRPGDLPQQPDVIFHLSLVRHFVDSGSISSLGADVVNEPGSPASYPAAFHGIAATLVLLTGAPVIIAEQAVLFVVAALVWPLGVMFLAWAALGSERHVVLFTGFVASSIAGFPFMLHNWGGVWPLEFGFSLIAPVVGAVALALRPDVRSASWASAALLVIAALPGLTLAHPSASFSAAYGGFAVAIAAAWRWAREGHRPGWQRWGPLAGLLVAGVAFVLVAAKVAPVGMKETSYDRGELVPQLLGQASLWSPKDDLYQAFGGVVMVLLLVGVARALMRRSGVWLVVCWAGFMLLGLVTRLLPGSATWVLTWPWYNLPVRLQAVAAIFAVPFVALGASWLLQLSARRSRLLGGLVLTVLGVVVAVQLLANATHLSRFYALSGRNAWISEPKAQALTELSKDLPDDAMVAANPVRGTSFLYLLGPEDVLIHTNQSASPDLVEIGTGLDRVLTDPAVCAAVKRERVTYVITGGDPYRDSPRPDTYGGIDGVSPEEGFVVVDQAGPYTLWKVPDCGE